MPEKRAKFEAGLNLNLAEGEPGFRLAGVGR